MEPQIAFAIDRNKNGVETENVRLNTARYDSGVHDKRRGENTAIAVTVGRGQINERPNGEAATRVAAYDKNGFVANQANNAVAYPINTEPDRVAVELEPIGGIYTGASPTPQFTRGIKDGCVRSLKAELHDSGVALKVKEATKQGYAVAHEGDSINLTMPDSETRRGRVGLGVVNTLDTQCNQGVPVIWYDKRKCYIAIRKLTPKECWRLQGWTDDYFERAQFVNSDTQLYKEAGNGVTVTVIQAIAERLGNDD